MRGQKGKRKKNEVTHPTFLCCDDQKVACVARYEETHELKQWHDNNTSLKQEKQKSSRQG